MAEAGNQGLSRSKSKEQVRREIDATLNQLEETLDEIRDRFSPAALSRQLKRFFIGDRRHGSSGKNKEGRSIMKEEYKDRVKHRVQDNPVSATVIAGAAIGGLVYALIKHHKTCTSNAHRPDIQPTEPTDVEVSRGQDLSGKFCHRASEWRQHASEKASEAKQGLESQIKANPLPLGLAALGAGLLVGLLVPETQWEDRMMGEKRDELLKEARERGREKLRQARHAAEEAKETFKEELSKE